MDRADPASRHALHASGCDWPEKNCYIDLWISVLHSLGMEPLALLGHTVAVDFAGDQWTFYKPNAWELRELYGIDVQEMSVWRPLLDHALEHLAAGRLIAAEVDAWWLPDTEATDYRRKHTKTTILLADIDTEAQRLGYFHNAGYFELEGEDWRRTLGIEGERELPLFAELVRIDRRATYPPRELAERAVELLAHHMRWRPQRNPFEAFAPRLADELMQMRERGLGYYHQWAFVALRQAGSAFELAAAHAEWLARQGHDCADAARSFRDISAGCKSLILKGARAAATGRVGDTKAPVDAMAQAWTQGMRSLETAVLQAA